MNNLDKVTIGDIKKVKDEISKLRTIVEWKRCIKKFATKHSLTDREAIDIANDKAINI